MTKKHMEKVLYTKSGLITIIGAGVLIRDHHGQQRNQGGNNDSIKSLWILLIPDAEEPMMEREMKRGIQNFRQYCKD